MIIVGLSFEGMAVLLVFVLLAVLGHGRSRRRQGMNRAGFRRSARKPATASSRSAVNSLLVRYDLVARYDAAGA
jgi:hypothetical protein